MSRVPSDLTAIRDRAHDIFMKGQVQISFSILEHELVQAAKSTNNDLYHQYALITIARQRMEMGEYVQADEAFETFEQITTEKREQLMKDDSELFFYLQCKYYHIKGKNKARSYYFQRARETFEAGLKFIEEYKPEPDTRIKHKFQCKLLEGLGLLFCEVLYFKKSEELFEQAESIYKNSINGLTTQDYFNFRLKKGTLLKRSGYFLKGIYHLQELEQDAKADKDAFKNEKISFKHKKLMFKINRDLARLHTLRREEPLAREFNAKAEKILKEEMHKDVQNNIKIAKFQLLKGIWTSKFDYKESSDEYLHAYELFKELSGSDDNYFGASSLIEIGNNSMRTKDIANSTAWLYKAHEALVSKFGIEHPLQQKYYSIAAELGSLSEDNRMTIDMAEKYVLISETTNVTKDGIPSLFLLDPILTLVSSLCYIEEYHDQALEQIEKMDDICAQNGLNNESLLILSAYTLKSIVLIRKEKMREAQELLEETYQGYLSQLHGDKNHPFLEQTLNQLGLLFKVNQETEKAVLMYGDLVQIKEAYYGVESESLLMPLKSLGQVQAINKQFDEAAETFERGIRIARKLFDTGKAKDKSNVKQILGDIIFSFYSMHESNKNVNEALKAAILHNQIMKEIHGEISTQHAYSLFLKSKMLLVNPTTSTAELLETINKAISIETEATAKRTQKSALLGRLYYGAGTAYYSQQDYQRAIQNYKKAIKIFHNHQEWAQMCDELEHQIEACKDKLEVLGQKYVPEEGEEDDKDDLTKSQTDTDEADNTAIFVGLGVAVIVGAAVYSFLRFRS